MNITRTIQSLLTHHECVIIPGFGGILKSYKSASVHASKHLFSPPASEISFNVNLKNDDGLLVHQFATNRGISYKKASKKIKTWVSQLTEKLNKKETVRIIGIGKFYFDLENNLQFIPRNKNNFHLPSYGLPEFQFFPISHVEELISVSRKKKLRTKSRSNVALVIFPILLIGLLTHYLIDFNKSPINNMMTADLVSSLFNKSDMDRTYEKTNSDLVINEVSTNKDFIEAVIAETNHETLIEPIAEVTESLRYAIILGSFKNEENAYKEQANLKQQYNIDTEIVDARPIYYKVSVPISNSKREAFKQLTSFRHINQDAWVFEHN